MYRYIFTVQYSSVVQTDWLLCLLYPFMEASFSGTSALLCLLPQCRLTGTVQSRALIDQISWSSTDWLSVSMYVKPNSLSRCTDLHWLGADFASCRWVWRMYMCLQQSAEARWTNVSSVDMNTLTPQGRDKIRGRDRGQRLCLFKMEITNKCTKGRVILLWQRKRQSASTQ